MLLGSYKLHLDDPASFVRLSVVVAFSLVVAVTIHEFSHALVAGGLEDTTARRLGRLSLNPIRHLNPGGTIMMLVAGFGWGKPVPVDLRRLAHEHTGTALVAAVRPLSNLVLAFVIAVPIKLGALGSTHPDLRRMSYVMTGGSKVLAGLVPPERTSAYNRLQRSGPAILVVTILIYFTLGLGILWGIIGPVVRALTSAANGG